jgi:hypothetical protein
MSLVIFNLMDTPHERDESIFEAALQLPPEERAAYFNQAGGVAILLMVVVFRIGKGMRLGERQAVYGFCLLALIEVAFRLLSFALKPNTQHLWYLTFALALFYIPPVVSAFRHWAAFK